MAATNSESSVEDDFMNLLNILGYAGEISDINRKKRSQQNDNVDVVIAAASKLDKNCDKNSSSNSSNINSEFKITENDAEKDIQLLHPHKPNNGSERRSSEKQKGQEASNSTKKTDAAQGEITSSGKNGNLKVSTHSTALEDTVSISDQVQERRLHVGALTRETTDDENDEQYNKQNDAELFQLAKSSFGKKFGNKNIESDYISIPTTESTQKKNTEYPLSTIKSSYLRTYKSENVVSITQTDNYEEVEQKTTPKGITDNSLAGKTDSVQNKTSNIEIFRSAQSEYQATPLTEPSIIKQTQSRLREQVKAEDVHMSAAANKTINSTIEYTPLVNYSMNTSDEQESYVYSDNEEFYDDDTDGIDDSNFRSKELSSTHTTTVQAHVDSDYTADPYFEKEINSTHHISSQSVTNISTASYHALNRKYTTKFTESNPSSASSNKSTDEINLQIKFRESTESNSNAASTVTEPTHATVIFNNSTTFSETSDINQNLKLEQPTEDILGMKGRTNSNQGKQNIEASFTEQMQSSQMKENQYPCSFPPMNYPMPPPQYFYPPYPPYPYPSPSNDQLKIIDTPFSRQQGPILIVNPPVMNYVPSYFPQVGSSIVDFNRVNQIQSVDPKGQYYMCNAIPAPLPNIVTVPAVEVRKIYTPTLVHRERYTNNISMIL